ncbi:MAG: FtsH protease activity modulator HflK [Calditrichaeota bacterium]|nr:MAG: FtsH protease activity modulator HflK [Calditrichota bacterium]
MQQRPPFDLNQFRPPMIPRNIWRIVIPALVILILLYGSFFTVGPEEVGIILRFGKYDREVQPGLNFKLPFIETVYKVKVRSQLKEEFGFATVKAGVRTEYATRGFEEVSLMLTGDLNVAEVEWIVQYRIKDPYNYLFKVRNPRQTFRDLNEAVMREVVGDRTINEVLNLRNEVETAVEEKLQNLCDEYYLGFEVEQVQLQSVTPPDPVKPAFNEVNAAEQEKEKLINQAQAEYNKVIPKARGEAARTIEMARGYALERVNQAKGDVARFNALFAEYRKAKEVTRQRLYIETLGRVLEKVGNKLITDKEAVQVLPLLDLNKKGGQK